MNLLKPCLINPFANTRVLGSSIVDTTYSDQFIDDLSSIVCKYYMCNKLNLSSKINKHEGTGIFASQNNCMFLVTSMMISKRHIIIDESKYDINPIKICIESKHTTPLFAVSFGIMGIQRQYYDKLLKHSLKHFQKNNKVGSFSGWQLMTEYGIANEKSSDGLDYVQLFCYKTPSWLLFKNVCQNAMHRPDAEVIGDINKGDKIEITISGFIMTMYHNGKRVMFVNDVDATKYVYFPCIGDTYNNNFEFELTVNCS